MQPIIFGVIGLLIGGALVYFLLVAKLQRQLASAERKLERANKAIEDVESQRSQQITQSQELQNARQQIQSLEASYQAQLSNLEQSYERQLQELEQAQGYTETSGISPDQVRQIEQSYQAQIQELQAAHRNEKEAVEQSYQSQIKELQEAHQHELEAIKQQIQPIQAVDSSTPTEEKQGGWGGTAIGAAAIAGAAGLAGWATSNFLHQDEEQATAETPETSESPEENWADDPMGQVMRQEAELAGWTESQPEVTEEPVADSGDWQETASPFETPEENWADDPMGQAMLQEAELAGWTESQPEVAEEITEGAVAEDAIAESPFETPAETPDANWVDSPFGFVAESTEDVAEAAAIAETETPEAFAETETDLASWTDTGETFETPDFETPEAFTEEIISEELVTEGTEGTEGTEELITETHDWQVAESSFDMPEATPEELISESPFETPDFENPDDNWVDSPFGAVAESAEDVAEAAAIAETETDLANWTDTGEIFETPDFETPEAFTEEIISETLTTEEPDITETVESPEAFTEEMVSEELVTEEPDISDLFDLAAEPAEPSIEENWADAPMGELDLTNWGETEQTPSIEESILSFEDNISAPESWDLGESLSTPGDGELPSLEEIENVENLSTGNDLDFLSMLKSEEEIPIAEPEAFSSFTDTAEPALPDFLGEETLETDLQLLDLLPTKEPEDLTETLAGETSDPFINFFDSETEKSDLEFLEMLKTEEDETINRSSLGDSEDLFGDLFTPEESSSPDINDLFGTTDNHHSPDKQDGGLEELFADDTLSFEDWDLPDSAKSTSP
ncbi:MAG: hypothetical protein VKJ02_01325 [Snowella sp.]|nr:hypothetical protein [Snowella sp.]